MYGSILFIGIFLSIMFLVAAIIIIYNKQISEGFEDQNKFEILQNVGMSQKEVKQTIQFQVFDFLLCSIDCRNYSFIICLSAYFKGIKWFIVM